MFTALAGISEFWARRSLKFWLAMGMALTFFPILISAIAGFVFYHSVVIGPLVDVSFTQRYILQPLQHVQLSLWDVSDSVVDFAVDGEAQRAIDYKRAAKKVDDVFAKLVPALDQSDQKVRDINKALSSWQKVAAIASAIVADGSMHADSTVGRHVEELEASMTEMGSHLETVYDEIRTASERTHDQALVDLTLLEYLAIAGFVISIICAALGVVLINRSLVTSMDQLAFGAARFAAGDREHHVEVHLPHELVNVANAFNMMSKQIVEQEKELLRAAATDGLTGLLNRRELDRILDDEVRRATRYGTSFSVVMSDIDHFKAFNDAYGHQAGDEALRAIARTIKESLRDVDKACRFGGEEFTLVLPACDAEAAQKMAERVRRATESLSIELDGQPVRSVTISLGIATFPDNGTTSETLLKRADEALYASKAGGRNRVTRAT